MNDRQLELLEKLGINADDFKPKGEDGATLDDLAELVNTLIEIVIGE